MKTIFRIIIILVAAALVAGAFNLAVGSNSGTAGQAPAFGNDSGHRLPDRDGGEGGEHGASFDGGLLGILGSLAKISAITALILLVQKGIAKLTSKPTNSSPTPA